MSSITCSSLIHLKFASFTRLSTDDGGASALWTKSTVSSLVTNSHSPSVATTTNLSVSGSSSRSVNSGSDETPAVWATQSPRDLTIIKKKSNRI